MSDISGPAKQAASRAESSDALDHLARAGLVAFGVVHLMMGWLAVQLALGDREGSASSTGAVRTLAKQPFGGLLVWAVASGMFLLAIWQLVEAAAGHRDRDGFSRVRKRATSAGKAVVYATIGYSAFQVATGSGSSSGGTDSTTAKLMDLPAGQVLVGLVALGIAVVAGTLIYKGWSERFLKDIDAEGKGGRTGSAYTWFGKLGYLAKGVALLMVAYLFGYAAVTHQAKKSGGLDQALVKVLEQPAGPVLLALIGFGIACFGLFCFAWARHIDR